MTTPPTTPPTTQLSILDEITTLQRLIRKTRRAIRKNLIDPVQGGRLIAQTSIALSKLILAQHRITPDPRDTFEQEMAETRAGIDRIFQGLGWDKILNPQP